MKWLWGGGNSVGMMVIYCFWCRYCQCPNRFLSALLSSQLVIQGIELLTELTEVVFCNGVIPTDWQESFILNLYKGKGDALERGNYRDLKLTDQVMKLLEHVLDSFIRAMVDIDPMQFGFVSGCGHFTSPLLIWRRLSTEYPGKFFGGP